MDIKAHWSPYKLDFKFLARTSREAMTSKDTYFISLPHIAGNGQEVVGECALFRGLSSDDLPDYEQKLSEACNNPLATPLYSSIRFGLETAFINGGYVSTPSTSFLRGEEGIPINGLIWMGDRREMLKRIDEKLDAGFHVLKLKIGGIDFDSELSLIKYIRDRYDSSLLELRLDANGSFSPEKALEKLERLSVYAIHSIEQPIRAGQLEIMAEICSKSPVDIALDEEIIGTPSPERVAHILDTVCPQYIILKPALCGGLSGADLWADEAEKRSIGWWATSALESNVGLLAIARWLASRGVSRPQGLGTGQLYHNNIPSGLYLKGERLYFNPEIDFELPALSWRR